MAAAEILKKLYARHKYAVKRLKALNLSEAPSELAEYIYVMSTFKRKR